MDCVAGVFREVDARIILLTFPKSSVMQIKQILVSVCSFCFLSIMMSSYAAGTSPEIDTRPLLRIGYIESSFSPFERKGFQDTFEYLQRELPQYRIRIQNYLVRDLERGVRNNEFEFFIGASGFYRRVFRRGLKDLATMTTPMAPDPNEAVGTVFMVPNDSPIKTVADMRGKRAAANFERGFSGVYVPLGEVAAQGYDPDNFFNEIVAAGSPMKKLLLAVQDGRAEIALARACTVEELKQTEPELVAQFRPIGLKANDGQFACLRSTDLYPNWTFVATTMAPWQASRDFTVALLSMPPTKDGVAWGVASDFLKADELYKTLRAGPYAYLRIQSVGDFLQKYWPFIVLFLMAVVGMMWHGRRVSHLVDVRTRELRQSIQKEKDAMQEVQSTKERLSQFERVSVIGAMSSLLAHEINGPVSAISNSCNALDRYLQDDDQHSPLIDKTVQLVLRQCERITSIVTQVRRYARHEDLAREPIELGSALEKIVSVMQMRYRKVKFELRRPPEDVSICWNPLEFELCLTNVMKNGAEACQVQNEAKVRVVLTRHEYTAEIAVLDNGQTDAKMLENASVPLRSGKKSGLGLGLLIVRTLIERASGNFSIVREAGHTVARIRLPLTETNNGADAG